MVMQHLTADGAGRPVLVKSAPLGEGGERLRHEAAMLEAARHPGVAQLLGCDEADGVVTVRIAVAGTRTLADRRGDLPGAVRALAALATTLADLHDLGIVHGRVSADHVVLDGAGRPVLCGFAGAGRRGDLDPAEDVAGLGSLLTWLVSSASGIDDGSPGGDWEPIPERRFGRSERWAGFARRALLTLADQARADDPRLRPSARAFATALLAAVPAPAAPRPWVGRALGRMLATWRRAAADDGDGHGLAVGPAARAGRRDQEPRVEEPLDAVSMLEAEAGPRPRPGDGEPRSRVLVPVAATVGLGLLVFGVGALLRPAEAPPPAGAAAPSRADAPAPRAAPTAPVPTCAPAAEPVADPDGDGCPSTVRFGEGVVEVDGVRFGVGRSGDLLAVGDWDCDGSSTVALVRRGTGEVFVFDGWARGGADVAAASSGTVPGASSLAPRREPGGCDRLVVIDEAGGRTEVPS